jgi:hypothetical protein
MVGLSLRRSRNASAAVARREKFEKNLVDLSGRLGKGRLVAPHAPPDGPLVEVEELVGGYMIVSAATLDEAGELARA